MHALIIFIAHYFIVIPLIITFFVFTQLKDKVDKRNLMVAVIVGGVVSLILARIASALWYDPRPFVVGHFTPLINHAADNGFPSDHTLLASFIGWTILRYSRKYGIVILITALIIGLARVFAGVHHIQDIAGSFIISALAVYVVMLVIKKIHVLQKS